MAWGDCVMPSPKGGCQDAKIAPSSVLDLAFNAHIFFNPVRTDRGFVFRDPITRHCEIIQG